MRSIMQWFRLYMLLLRFFLCCVFIVAASATAAAEQSDIQPGKYIRDNDSGTLNIQSIDGDTKLTFEIESVGGNCHEC